MATFDVSPAEVLRALKDARSGDVLKLRGEFPSMHVRKRDLPQSFDVPVTIDLTQATVTGWQFSEIDGLCFVGGLLRPASSAAGNGVLTYGHGLRFNNCKRIASTGLRGRGPAAFEEGEPFAYGDGIAFWVLGGEDVEVRGFDLRGFKNGISIGKTRRFQIEGGACADMRSDGIQIAQSWEGRVTRNVVHASRKRDTEHPDGIQMWSRPDAPPTSDIEISDNVIVGRTQGITAFNHVRDGVDDGGFDRLVIRGNQIAVEYPQALAIYSGRNITVSDNVIRTLPGATSRASLNLNNCSGVTRSGNAVGAGAGKKADNDPAPVSPPIVAGPDPLRELIARRTVIKQEPLKTKGRASLDWKTPAEADAFIAAVIAIAPTA